MTLIAEDLLMLLLDDASGKPILDSTKLPRVLAGAVVLELAMSDSVRITGAGESVKKGRMVTGKVSPTDPILLDAYRLIESKSRPMQAKSAIEKLQRGLRNKIAGRLVEQGLVAEKHIRIMGIFPNTRWPALNTEHEVQTRSQIRSALVDNVDPSPRIAALISLLSAVDVAHKVVPDADKKLVKNRAKTIASGAWAADAVRQAVQDINTAVMVAVMIPAITSTS